MKLHILQTGTRMNPLNPRRSVFFEPGLVAYVARDAFRRDGIHSLKIITSWGHLGKDFELGRMVQLIADQTGKTLGHGEIIAIVDLTTMARYLHPLDGTHWIYWHDLDRDIKHYVVK
jgi:hypothetical protein